MPFFFMIGEAVVTQRCTFVSHKHNTHESVLDELHRVAEHVLSGVVARPCRRFVAQPRDPRGDMPHWSARLSLSYRSSGSPWLTERYLVDEDCPRQDRTSKFDHLSRHGKQVVIVAFHIVSIYQRHQHLRLIPSRAESVKAMVRETTVTHNPISR